MNPTIRKAEAGDIRQIQRLYKHLDGYHAGLLPQVFCPVDRDARGDDVLHKWIDRDDADYLLAEMDGRVVGFVNVQCVTHPKYPMFRPHEYVMIENVVVDEVHRGKGLGTLLFRATIDWARDHGLQYVQTTVWNGNADAKGFYLAQGFHPTTMKLEMDTEKYAEPSSAGDEDKPRV